MSFSRIPSAGITGLPISAPPGGSLAPGGGATTRPGGPDGLSARPVLARAQSMPPRVRLPAGPAARPSSAPAGAVHESPDHATQEPTPAPAVARTNESRMNQLRGLRVDPSAANGPAGGAAPPEKPAAELPLNTFFTVDLPPPAASGGGPEKLKLNTSVTVQPAGKMQGESTGGAGTPGRPVTEPPPGAPAASGGGGPDKPGRVHVDASVNIEPPATGAGGPSVPPQPPHVMSEMQMLQETQRLGMQQQADMQKMAIENQVLTARLKLEMDLTTAVTDFIKKQGEAIKHAAAG